MHLGCVSHAREINSVGNADNALIWRAVPAFPTGPTARFGFKHTPLFAPEAAIVRLPGPCSIALIGCFEWKIWR